MSATYEITPKIKTFPIGTIFKNKYDLYGTNAAGVNEHDADFGAEDVHIPADSILTFVDDRQFMASTKTYSLSAHIRFHFIVNEKVVWITICKEVQRIWNFETYLGKRRKLTDNINEMFEIIPVIEEEVK